MSKAKIAGAILGAALALSVAGSANAAVVFSSSNESFNMNFSGKINNVDLSAAGTLTIESLTDTSMRIALSLTNSTPFATEGVNRITAFGFNIGHGGVSSAAIVSTTPEEDLTTPAWRASTNSRIYPDINMDVCAFDTNGCSNLNPSTEGIFETITESLLLDLAGDFSAPFLSITRVVVRFAGVGENSGIRNGYLEGLITTPQKGPTDVPEPATLALLGTGLLGLGLMRRRKAGPAHVA